MLSLGLNYLAEKYIRRDEYESIDYEIRLIKVLPGKLFFVEYLHESEGRQHHFGRWLHSPWDPP
ncbi:hypothetical protein JCM14036_02730 [Desulfotomaculum defluvii]